MTYPSEVLADNPLIYWRLGEASGTAAADASGNGHIGIYVVAPALGATGLLTGDADTAVEFIANSGEQAVNGDDTLAALSAPGPLAAFAMEIIVDLADTSDRQLCLVSPSDASTSVISSNCTLGELSFDFQGTSAYSPSATASISSGIHHIVFEFTGTELNLYLDGVEVDTQPFVDDGAVFVNDSFFRVGNYPNGDSGSTATLDEAAFYAHALGATRVAAHYAAMVGEDPPPDPGPTDPADGCLTVAVPGFLADGATADVDGIVYTPELVGGWYDSIPMRSATSETQPRGEHVTVAQELGRDIELVIVAHLPGNLPLGSVLCFAAMETIKTAFRILFVPVALQVIDPFADRSALARRVGPIKQRIVGNASVVRASIPLLCPDPRRLPT